MRNIEDDSTVAAWTNTWGLVVTRQHPGHRQRITRAARRGELVRMAPGVYRPPGEAPTLAQRLGMVVARHPQAVFTHHAAAALSWWPEIEVGIIRVRGPRVTLPGVVTDRGLLAEFWVDARRGVRFACPAMSVLQLTGSMGGDVIDRALRVRAVTLGELERAAEAIPAKSPGLPAIRQLLADSRDEPWSHLERLAHRDLRVHHLTGWRANHRITVGDRWYYADIAFPSLRLVVELDGWATHGGRLAWERDCSRQNDLVLAGWTVLRFSMGRLPEMVPAIRAHARRLGRPL
ncbi:DUF559 domain-containing protein [Aestuariimicrobium soli]|uniref:DUF559 domain-containing protein n=1 Tax=Aestuariimicrobium soli TaxID=2035834 RepID=UPI003EB801B2